MASAKAVNMWQHGGDALGLWGETVKAQQWVKPDQAPRRQAQALHLVGQRLGRAAIQTIRYQQCHRALPQHPARPIAVERRQAITNTGAAFPILRLTARRFQRGVHIALSQMTGDIGQACSEGERMYLRPPLTFGICDRM